MSSHAQRRRDDTAHYRTAPIPAHLMPIERGYGSSSLSSVYFYGRKRLSSPYSLEVPFYEINDPIVNHHFQVFKTLTWAGRLTGFVPLGYLLFQGRNANRTTYWTIVGGSVAATLTLAIIGNSHVNKAVTRYNGLLRQPRVGLSVAPVPLTGQAAVGGGVAWSF